MNRPGLTRMFSLFLMVFVVGIIAYWVIQASLPTEGPRVSFLFRNGDPYAEITVPYPCTEAFRIFRSVDDGALWNRVLSPAEGGDKKECLFHDSLVGVPKDTTSIQYRYSRIDAARDISYLSHASLLHIFQSPLF
ncbi:MAG: hypothetical protein Q8P01_05540 [bacterium]|nr:hypothetical protein [bacterium]